MSKRIAALSVAMLAVAAILPATASATNFTTKTTIAITPVGNAFTGRVSSPRSSCVPSRHVTLQRKLPGHTSFANIGTDTTASNGAWSINTNPVNNAQYRAQVAVKNLSGGNKCLAATSPVTTARATNTTIVQGGSTNFHGKLSSVTACLNNRKVTLQRRASGQQNFTNVGSDNTDSAGNWVVPTAVVSGAQYRARVNAKQSAANSCMAKTSAIRVAT